MHILGQYHDVADRIAGAVLGIAAQGLEEREKAMEEGEPGVREVLRGLSRVIER